MTLKAHRWLLLALIYPLLNGVVLFAEYRSEMSKIDRGTVTDTFSPYMLTHGLTLPMSVLNQPWDGYNAAYDRMQLTGFNPDALRAVAREALPGEIVNIAVQSVLILGLAWLVRTAWGRRGSSASRDVARWPESAA